MWYSYPHIDSGQGLRVPKDMSDRGVPSHVFISDMDNEIECTLKNLQVA